jgi:hypothetical protein
LTLEPLQQLPGTRLLRQDLDQPARIRHGLVPALLLRVEHRQGMHELRIAGLELDRGTQVRLGFAVPPQVLRPEPGIVLHARVGRRELRRPAERIG